jgi:arginase
MKNRILILSQYDIAAGKRGSADGPSAVKSQLIQKGIDCSNCIVLENNNSPIEHQNNFKNAKFIDTVVENASLLEQTTYNAIKSSKTPVILSGDHGNAIGGFSGLKNAFPNKRIGIIWIDAHADLHTPYTTPSGNIHGMPLAALAGIDNSENSKNKVTDEEIKHWNQLKKIGNKSIYPKFSFKDLVFIGLRDAEEEEWDLIIKHNIRHFEPKDIKNLGIQNVLTQTLEYLNNCDIIYVSFDADSLDPSISVGTGTPSPNGLLIEEAEYLFNELFNHPKLGVFEISEVNPNIEQGNQEMGVVISNLLAKAINQ